MRNSEFISSIFLKKGHLAYVLFTSTVLSLSFFGYFSCKSLFVNLDSLVLLFLFLIASMSLVTLMSGISSVLLARIKKINLKEAFCQDSKSYFASIIILFILPLVVFYPEHSALSGYAKPFFLLAWLACCICLKVGLNISEQNMKKMLDWINKNIAIILTIIFGSYILLFFGLAKLKFVNFGGYMTDDAHVLQFFAKAYRGQYLGETVVGDSLLGIHLSFILYIFLVPYFFYPSINTILMMKSTMIGVSGIPLFLILKENHNSIIAILILLSYLLFHQVAGAIVSDFHEVIFAPFFLLYTYYFFRKEKFFLFLIFFMLCLSVKENISIVVFVFGIYALMMKRDKKWILTPIVLSIGWFFLGFKILFPYFSKLDGLPTVYNVNFEQLVTNLKNPHIFVRSIGKRWLALIYTLFQPVLFVLPLLSVEFMFVLPWFLIKICLGGNPQIRTWHFMILIGFLFIAYANSLFKIEKIFRYKRYAFGISIIGLFVSISCIPYWFRVEEYIAKPYIEAQREIIELIPIEASVCAPEYMLPYIVNRKKIYNEVSFQKGMRKDIDFIIFDSNIKRYGKDWEKRDITPEFINKLRELARFKKSYLCYEYFWDKDGMFIYKNKSYKFKL